jgi:uncharacterized protein YdhG (YjbR/CyaY superfamily)
MPILTVDAYFLSLPPDLIPFVSRIRDLIHAAAPEVTEAIKYQMPVFYYQGTYLFYLGAWKAHVGLYPIARGNAAFEAVVGPLRTTKDTVRLRYRDPLPESVVTLITRTRIAAINQASVSTITPAVTAT